MQWPLNAETTNTCALDERNPGKNWLTSFNTSQEHIDGSTDKKA